MNDEHVPEADDLAAELEEARRRIEELESAAAQAAVERERAEDELRATEAWFRALVEQAPIGIYLTDTSGDCSFVNARWSAMAGLSQDEAHGRGWLDGVHPDDRATIGERWYKSAQSGGRWGFEYRFRDRDGKVTWVFGTAAPLHDAQGQLTGYVGVNTDVTARRTAETALRESEAKYRGVVERASDGIVIARGQHLCFANAAFAAMSGYTLEELDGISFLTMVLPEQRTEVADRVRRRLAGEDVPSTYEIDLVRKSGETFSVEVQADAITYLGEPADLVVMRDITERRETEIALRRMKAMRDGAEAVAHVGSWRWELASQRSTWSPGMYPLFDVEPGEFDGHSMPILESRVHPEDLPALLATTADVVESGEPVLVEYRVVHRDGSEHVLLGEGSAERDEAGTTTAITGYYQDVTEQRREETEIRRLNAELEERVVSRTMQRDALNRELEALAYSASHDLRAPLRAIDGFAAMIAEDAAGRLSGEDLEYLQRMRGAAQRMAQLVDDLLGLSRLSRQDLIRAPVDISALCLEVADELRTEHPDRQVEVCVEPGMSANADGALVRVILYQLLDNAWKFTGKHAMALIEVGTSDADEPAFFVRDDGAGFDPRYAEHLFGAFQRMHTPEEFEGDGIGLATVQRLVVRHGGLVRAEAEIEKGCTFYFTLPSA